MAIYLLSLFYLRDFCYRSLSYCCVISELRVMYVLFCPRESMNMRTNVSRMQKVVNRKTNDIPNVVIISCR